MVVGDNSPTARADSVSRAAGLNAKVKIANLLTNDSDVDLDTLSFVSSSATTNGQALTSDDTYIYIPANPVADAFTESARRETPAFKKTMGGGASITLPPENADLIVLRR